jgi:hypothetical protein
LYILIFLGRLSKNPSRSEALCGVVLLYIQSYTIYYTIYYISDILIKILSVITEYTRYTEIKVPRFFVTSYITKLSAKVLPLYNSLS